MGCRFGIGGVKSKETRPIMDWYQNTTRRSYIHLAKNHDFNLLNVGPSCCVLKGKNQAASELLDCSTSTFQFIRGSLGGGFELDFHLEARPCCPRQSHPVLGL